MEHRWSSRKKIQGTVAFELSPREKYQAELCDISLGGLSVISPVMPIDVNTVVTLAFHLENNDRVSHHRMPAQVAYSDATRTGFLFMQPGTETWQVLREMLYQPEGNTSATTAGHPRAA